MPRLHHLNLSDNLLDHLSDDTFAKNEELELLDLSDNYLGNLTENTFKGLEVLKVSDRKEGIKYQWAIWNYG